MFEAATPKFVMAVMVPFTMFSQKCIGALSDSSNINSNTILINAIARKLATALSPRGLRCILISSPE